MKAVHEKGFLVGGCFLGEREISQVKKTPLPPPPHTPMPHFIPTSFSWPRGTEGSSEWSLLPPSPAIPSRVEGFLSPPPALPPSAGDSLASSSLGLSNDRRGAGGASPFLPSGGCSERNGEPALGSSSSRVEGRLMAARRPRAPGW